MLHLFTILPLLAGTLGNAILGSESLSTRGIGVLHWKEHKNPCTVGKNIPLTIWNFWNSFFWVFSILSVCYFLAHVLKYAVTLHWFHICSVVFGLKADNDSSWHFWQRWISALLCENDALLANASTAGGILDPHTPDSPRGNVLEPRECRLPNMGVTGRFLQPLCSSVVLGPPMPLIMHAGGQDGGSKAANLSSILIISCASSAQRNFSLFQTPAVQPTTSNDNAAGIRLHSMWPCF